MGYIKYVEVSCDICGDVEHYYSVADMKKALRRKGWSFNGTTVKCSECKQVKKENY